MTCPWCRSDNVMCKDSRPAGIGRRRRYACQACRGRFSTIEMPYMLEREIQRRAKNSEEKQT